MFEKRSDLNKLLTVVEEGTIHSAAEKLHITQPALSRVVSKLERQFNGQIFERLPRGVRLTQFGAMVLDQVQHILREMEHAEKEIDLILKGRGGALRISAGPLWMHALLPQVVRQFHEDFPMVELILNTTSFSQGIKLIREGKSDLHCGTFTSSESIEPLPNFIAVEHLSKMSFNVVAHERHPIHSKKVPSYTDLIEYPWIDYELETRPSQIVQIPSLDSLLQKLENRTGRSAMRVLRTNSAGLHLMGAGPYLAYLCSNLAKNIADISLKPVSIKAFDCLVEAVILSLRDAQGTLPLNHFKAILKRSALEVTRSGGLNRSQ